MTTPPKRKFTTYPIGYCHINIAEVQTAEGKLRPSVAIDRTSKLAFVESHQEGGKMIAAQCVCNLIATPRPGCARCSPAPPTGILPTASVNSRRGIGQYDGYLHPDR